MRMLFLAIAVRLKRFWIWLREIWLYYRNFLFMRIDLTLISYYMISNPYHISRLYLEEQAEENVYTYGETPLEIFEAIMQEAGLSETDVVAELGCGRGRSCFWLSTFHRCEVVGVEMIPPFVNIAQHVQAKYGLEGIAFVCGDMLDLDYSKVTLVYLYGSALSDAFIERLARCLRGLPKGARVVTVSYPLIDAEFTLLKEKEFPFLWGRASVYFHSRN